MRVAILPETRSRSRGHTPAEIRRPGAIRLAPDLLSSCVASLLLPNDFIVARPRSFPHHPTRRRLERPSVSSERTVITSHGRRYTAGAAIGCNQHAFLRVERPPRA